MPRDYAQLFTSVWDDKDWLALPIDGQWLYGLLISQKSFNRAGIVPLPRQMWANHAADDDSADRIAAALKILEDRRFVVIDYSTDELLVRSFIRRDIQKGPPGAFRSAMDCAVAVRSPRLRAVLYAELQRLDWALIEAKKPGQGHRERPIDALRRAMKELAPDAPEPGPGESWPVDGGQHGMAHGMEHGMPHGVENAEKHGMPHGMGHTPGAVAGAVAVAPRLTEEINSSFVSAPRAQAPAHTHTHAHAHATSPPDPSRPARNGLAVVADTGRVDLPEHARPEPEPEPSSAAVVTASAASAQAQRIVEREFPTWEVPPTGRYRMQWVHAISTLLIDGIPADPIVTGMRACAGKGYGPRSLDGFVFGEANRRPDQSRADRNFAAITARIEQSDGPSFEELKAAEAADRLGIASRARAELSPGPRLIEG